MPVLGHAQLTSGADFLKLAGSARGVGMGDAFVAVADDVTALTWNPAGIALLQYPEVGYLRMQYLSDTAYNFAGAVLPMPMEDGSAGMGVGFINLGVPTFDSTLGIAPSVSAGDYAFFLSGAYRIKNIISFGLTGKYIMRNIAGYNGNAFGGDIGFLITPGSRWRIGGGVFNVGSSVQFVSAADPLPTLGRFGVAFQVLDLPQNTLLLSLEGYYQFLSQAYQGGVGAEYWYDKTLAVRAGFVANPDTQFPTVGIGMNLKLFQLDYAYAPFGTLGDTHRISALLRFGAEEAEGLLAPSGFSAKTSDSALSLSWNPVKFQDVVGYNLYVEKPGAQIFIKANGAPINETSVNIHHLQNGQSYSFAVASISAAGRESGRTHLTAIPGSLTASSTSPVLEPPTGFKVFAEVEGLHITWDKSTSPAIRGFNLYLADETGKPSKKLNSLPITDNTVVLKKVNPDHIYRFVLTSVNKAGGESAPTQVLEAQLSGMLKSNVATLLPPKQLNVTLVQGGAELSWDPVQGTVGFNIYVSNDGKGFSKLTKQGPKAVTSAILKPLKNKRYYFAVTSVSANGQESDKVISQPVTSP